jgi:hypothetical protein
MFFFFLAGFHKAVGEHSVSICKRMTSKSLNIEDEPNQNK